MSHEYLFLLLLQTLAVALFFGNYLIPDDPDGAEDFRAATAGIPSKLLGAWMKVSESQITRWRKTGNVPGGRLKLLESLDVPDEREREQARDVVRVFRELQARRSRAIVIPRDAVTSAAEFVTAFLQSVGWRPEPLKASLAVPERAVSVECRKRVSSAA